MPLLPCLLGHLLLHTCYLQLLTADGHDSVVVTSPWQVVGSTLSLIRVLSDEKKCQVLFDFDDLRLKAGLANIPLSFMMTCEVLVTDIYMEMLFMSLRRCPWVSLMVLLA